jgi:uncharacterized protein DUF6894
VRHRTKLGFMPRYYFDYHEPNGAIHDHVGQHLPGPDAARKLALTALGEAIHDFAAAGYTGRIVLEVRDEREPVLTVSAVVDVQAKYAPSTSRGPNPGFGARLSSFYCSDRRLRLAISFQCRRIPLTVSARDRCAVRLYRAPDASTDDELSSAGHGRSRSVSRV